MWHAFDILPRDLAVEASVRASRAGDACRLTYAQLAVRWFKSKNLKGQWPATVDRYPGITLVKRRRAEGGMMLEVEQRWPHAVEQVLGGTMHCAAGGWRSPVSWSFRQQFKDRARASKTRLGPLEEQGTWDGKTLARTTGGAKKQSRQTEEVAHLGCTYSLLADFPGFGEISALPPATLLCDGLTLMRQARIAACGETVQQHKLAEGLKGHAIGGAGGFPLEFWTNEHGVVVYMLAGPVRAFVLEKVEAIS